jgi:hypothetical protein
VAFPSLEGEGSLQTWFQTSLVPAARVGHAKVYRDHDYQLWQTLYRFTVTGMAMHNTNKILLHGKAQH